MHCESILYLSPDMLPLPMLVLQQQTDVWHLVCTGSPAYPGAVFSLYLVDDDLSVATQHSNAFNHQATFAVPVQDTPVVLYQCQYSVLLGSSWHHSERSRHLAVNRGTCSHLHCVFLVQLKCHFMQKSDCFFCIFQVFSLLQNQVYGLLYCEFLVPGS